MWCKRHIQVGCLILGASGLLLIDGRSAVAGDCTCDGAWSFQETQCLSGHGPGGPNDPPREITDPTSGDSLIADTQDDCHEPRVWVKACGYPGGSGSTLPHYSSFSAHAQDIGVRREMKFEFLDSSAQLCPDAPNTDFRFYGTRRFSMFTQGDPSNGDMDTIARVTATHAGSMSLAANAVYNSCGGTLDSSSNASISKTEGVTEQFTARVTFPPGFDYHVQFVSDERWQCNEPRLQDFNCYLRNTTSGTGCGAARIIASAQLSAECYASGNRNAWGAQMDLEARVINLKLERIE